VVRGGTGWYPSRRLCDFADGEFIVSKRHDVGQMIVITKQGEFERESRRGSSNHVMCKFQAKDLESGRTGIHNVYDDATKTY